MTWLGEYPEDFTTVVCMFSTSDSNGANVAPLSAFEAADVKIYKNGSATEKATTNGLTMTSPFDSTTGTHCLVIDTSNDTGDSGFWTTGGGDVFTIMLSPDSETVNGQSVVGKIIGQFGIELSRALRPTTAGRKLDVSAGGEAGVDWANVGSPTTTVTLSGTTVKTATDVETDTQDIQSRLPAALTGAGNIKADMLAISDDATAANNLETMLDGTGGQNLNLGKLIIAASSGNAMDISTAGGNGHAIALAANGSGSGISSTGGATGHGFLGTGGATSGDGIRGRAQNGNSCGADFAGVGSGHGIKAAGGTGVGSGIHALGASDGDGISSQGQGDGAGLALHGGLGGAGTGPGMYIAADGSGAGLQIEAGPDSTVTLMIGTQFATGNCAAIIAQAHGAYAGFKIAGGATGPGAEIVGGSTSGKGVTIVTVDGHALDLIANGALKAGINVYSAAGDGIDVYARGAAGTGVALWMGSDNDHTVWLQNYTANKHAFFLDPNSATGFDAATIADFQSGLATASALATVKLKTDLIPGDMDGQSLEELLTLLGSVALGKVSGLNTTTAVFRAMDDSKDRVSATVDKYGSRSAVTLDAS